MSKSNPYAATVLQSVEPIEPVTEKVTIPSGSISEIKGWVGSNITFANLALEAEISSGEPRKTLVAYLKNLIEND